MSAAISGTASHLFPDIAALIRATLAGRHHPGVSWGIDDRDHTGNNLPAFVRGMSVRHPIDVATMFAALWLLGSMVIDLLTPKELTVYMIAAAIAPAVIGTGLCYYLRFPKLDFGVILATLWLIAALALEWISPAPLSVFVIGAALAPALIVGAVLHWHRYRSSARRRTQAVSEERSMSESA